MNRAISSGRWPAPWIRGAIAVYLIGVVLAAALHQHHDPVRAHDCALCTVAHIPGVLPQAAADAALAPSPDATPRLLAEAVPEVEPLGPPSSRAPPIA